MTIASNRAAIQLKKTKRNGHLHSRSLILEYFLESIEQINGRLGISTRVRDLDLDRLPGTHSDVLETCKFIIS